MTTVVQALDEIRQTFEQNSAEAEGLRDFASTNLQPETRSAVEAQTRLYNTRIILENKAMDALLRLLEDGYPEMPVLEVEGTVFDDLSAQQASMAAAIKKFKLIQAAKLTAVVGAEERK